MKIKPFSPLLALFVLAFASRAAEPLPTQVAPGQSETKPVAEATQPDLAQTTKADQTKILAHTVHRDVSGKLLGWYRPEVPGAVYDHVIKLASAFVKDGTPNDPKTGLPIYFVSCSFNGPQFSSEEAFRAGKTWDDWMNNPACFFAGAVQSLAVDFHGYTGDRAYIDLVRRMLDHQLKFGTTPAGWPWPNVPYASADPGNPVYEGATRWENAGMRGDGLHGIEPDKVGELGIGYVKFFELTEEPKYLEAALHSADALAKHVRDVTMKGDDFAETQSNESPWPYRVNARTGRTIDPYTANVIEPIRLLEELLRLRERIGLSPERVKAYERANNLAWNWLLSKNGPLISYVWNGYFEDVPSDPKLGNRVQNIPMETARHMLKHPRKGFDADRHVQAMLSWVKSAFGEPGEPSINEQTWCYVPMGSHTARYASIQALMYERTGDVRHKDEAFEHFNWATYSTATNGVVSVGPRWQGTWWSDGYGDYIRHFMEGIAAVPEWAPANENHLLRSSSVVQQIRYEPGSITYRAFDDEGTERLRLTSKPKQVKLGQRELREHSSANGIAAASTSADGWTWKALDQGGGVLDIRRSAGRDATIVLR
jgi:hypothetical protein